MKLRKIEFEGIRAFSDKTVFHFGRDPGLYFLQGGENEVDPELGSNGVGKTTIWSALCWILFGKTAEGLKAGDLHSWQSDKKGYYGTLWADRHIIKRSWKPNKLTFDGEVVEQQTLEDRLGISFETFTSAVLLSQGQDMFFDLPAPKKLSVFTSMLQLDNWIEYSVRAKEKADDIAELMHENDNVISRLSGKIDGLDTQGLEEKSEQFKSERYKDLVLRNGQLNELKHDFTEIKGRVGKCKEHRRKLKTQTTKFDSDKAEADAALEELELTAGTLQKKLLRILPKIATLENKLEYFEEHKNKRCVSCDQHISSSIAEKQLKILHDKVDQTAEISYPLIKRSKINKRKIAAKEAEIAAYANDLKGAQKIGAEADERYVELMEDYSKVKAAKQISFQRLEETKKSTNPYKELLKQKKEREAKLLRKLKKKKQRIDLLQHRKDNTEFWVQGFKDIRLYLIEEALLQLELATNKALHELGFSSEWAIKYSIEKTTKRGSLISGFNVLVKSPYSDTQVPFAVWSGGERQRLKIAGSMGFISLVHERTGLDLGLEVYDEPTQHLSPEGIDSLLEALYNRSIQTGKRIWLVDHHTLDYGNFVGHVIANKDSEGRSSICVGN